MVQLFFFFNLLPKLKFSSLANHYVTEGRTKRGGGWDKSHHMHMTILLPAQSTDPAYAAAPPPSSE